jgi:hypothetical protein
MKWRPKGPSANPGTGHRAPHRSLMLCAVFLEQSAVSSSSQSTIVGAALLYCCILPGAHRFFRSASYCSELLTKNLAVSYPKIIRVSVHLHRVPPTGHIDCVSAHH